MLLVSILPFAFARTRLPPFRPDRQCIDFRRRFLTLLTFKFREFGSVTALSVLEAAAAGIPADPGSADLSATHLSTLLTPFDLKRLQSYADNALDYHVILDLLPAIAGLYFEGRMSGPISGEEGGGVRLSAVQSAILLAIGLQRKSVEEVEKELQLPIAQTLALFVKTVRKISKRLGDVQKAAISATLPSGDASASTLPMAAGARVAPAMGDVDMELDAAGMEVEAGLRDRDGAREKQRAMIDALDLSK